MAKMSCCTSFQLPWPKECSGAIDSTIGLVPMVVPMMSKKQKMSCCNPFWSSWSKECNGAIADVVHIIWCWCQWHQMTKSHATPYFNCLNMRNAVIPLLKLLASYDSAIGITLSWHHCQYHHMTPMPMALCDTDASANGFKWQKSLVVPHFIVLT